MPRRIKFTNKKISKEACISLGFSAFTLMWILISLNVTSWMGEDAPRVIGGIAMLCFILQIAAIILGVRSIKDEDAFIQLPVAALVAAGLLETGLVVFIILGVVGLVS